MKNFLFIAVLILGLISCNKEEIEPLGHLRVTFSGPNKEDLKGHLVRIYPYESILIEDKSKWGNIAGERTDEDGVFLSEPLNPGNYVSMVSYPPDPALEPTTQYFQINAGKVAEINFFINR